MCQQLLAKLRSQSLIAPEQPGAGQQLHLVQVAVGDGDAADRLGRPFFALPVRLLRLSGLKDRCQYVGDLIVRKRLNGIVEYLLLSISGFFVAARRP